MWSSLGKRPKEIKSPSNYLCCNFVNSFSVVVFIVCVVDSTCPYVIAGMIWLQLWYWLKSCAAACSSGTHSLHWPHRLSASANSEKRIHLNINPPQLSDTHTQQKSNTTIVQQHKPTPNPSIYHKQILLNQYSYYIHHSHSLTQRHTAQTRELYSNSKPGVCRISNLWFSKLSSLVLFAKHNSKDCLSAYYANPCTEGCGQDLDIHIVH